MTKQDITVAGLAVLASDTGRVLMLQRALEEGDPAGGMWEFPGGHIENGETPIQGAFREWSEETGIKLTPPDSDSGLPTWTNGIYQGFVYEVPSEASVQIFDRAEGSNPDDPDGDMVEALAWWDPDLLKKNPAVRTELRQSLNVVLPAIEQEERVRSRRAISKGFNSMLHPRWEAGTGRNGGRFRSLKQVASSLADKAETDEGFTFHGTKGFPNKGFPVARPGNSYIAKDTKFFGGHGNDANGAQAIYDYIKKNAAAFEENPDLHLGAWHDSSNGEVVLDLVDLIPDEATAVRVGRERGEQAVFNLETFTEIPTGGTGGRENYTIDKAARRRRALAKAPVTDDRPRATRLVRGRRAYCSSEQGVSKGFDPLEARDWHGEWTKGESAAKKKKPHGGEKSSAKDIRSVYQGIFERHAAAGHPKAPALPPADPNSSMPQDVRWTHKTGSVAWSAIGSQPKNGIGIHGLGTRGSYVIEGDKKSGYLIHTNAIDNLPANHPDRELFHDPDGTKVAYVWPSDAQDAVREFDESITKRADERRLISKHGHKGQPGYELLHPGKGKVFEAANANPNVLKWDEHKLGGDVVHNSFVSRAGDHNYVISEQGGGWKVRSDGKLLQGKYSNEKDAASAAQKLHNTRTGKDLPAIHEAATPEGMKKLGVTDSVPKVNVNDGKSEKHVVAPETPKSTVKQAEKTTGKTIEPAGHITGTSGNKYILENKQDGKVVLWHNTEKDGLKHLSTHDSMADASLALMHHDHAAFAENKPAPGLLNWKSMEGSNNTTDIQAETDHGIYSAYPIGGKWEVYHDQGSKGTKLGSELASMKEATQAAEDHHAAALLEGDVPSGLKFEPVPNMPGFFIAGKYTKLDHGQKYLIGHSDDTGKWSVMPTLGQKDIIDKEFNSKADAIAAANDHYLNGAWRNPSLNWKPGYTEGNEVTGDLDHGQNYVLHSSLDNPGMFKVTAKHGNGALVQLHSSALDAKIAVQQHYENGTWRKQAEDAAKINPETWKPKLGTPETLTNVKHLLSTNGGTHEHPLEWKNPGSYYIEAKNPLDPHGKDSYTITGGLTHYDELKPYGVRGPDGNLISEHDTLFDALMAAQKSVDDGKFAPNPADKIHDEVDGYKFAVGGKGYDGDYSASVLSKVPGSSRYNIRGKDGEYKILSGPVGHEHDPSYKKSSLSDGTVYKTFLDAQKAVVAEDKKNVADFNKTAFLHDSKNKWDDVTVAGDSREFSLGVKDAFGEGKGAVFISMDHSSGNFQLTWRGEGSKNTQYGNSYSSMKDAVYAGDQAASDLKKYGVVWEPPSQYDLLTEAHGDNRWRQYANWNLKGSNLPEQLSIQKFSPNSEFNPDGNNYQLQYDGVNIGEFKTLEDAKFAGATFQKQAPNLGPMFNSFEVNEKGGITKATGPLFTATRDSGIGAATFTLSEKGGKVIESNLNIFATRNAADKHVQKMVPPESEFLPEYPDVAKTGNLTNTAWKSALDSQYQLDHSGGYWHLQLNNGEDDGYYSSYDNVEAVPASQDLKEISAAAHTYILEATAERRAKEEKQLQLVNSIQVPRDPNIGQFHDPGSTPLPGGEGVTSEVPHNFLHQYDELSLVNNRDKIKDRLVTQVSTIMASDLEKNPEALAQWNEHKGNSSATASPNRRQVYSYANDLVAQWAGTSGDHDSTAIAIQISAARLFNLRDKHVEGLDKNTVQNAQDVIDNQGLLINAFLTAQYKNTQAALEANGVPEMVTLYRGMRFNEEIAPEWTKDLPAGENVKLNAHMNPLTSWSSDWDTSYGFAGSGGSYNAYGMVIAAQIPRASILGTARTGNGCASEYEFVVVGGDGLAQAKVWGAKAQENKYNQEAKDLAPGWSKDHNEYIATLHGQDYSVLQSNVTGTYKLYNNGEWVSTHDTLSQAQGAAKTHALYHALAPKTEPDVTSPIVDNGENWKKTATSGPLSHYTAEINGVHVAIAEKSNGTHEVLIGGEVKGSSVTLTGAKMKAAYYAGKEPAPTAAAPSDGWTSHNAETSTGKFHTKTINGVPLSILEKPDGTYSLWSQGTQIDTALSLNIAKMKAKNYADSVWKK